MGTRWSPLEPGGPCGICLVPIGAGRSPQDLGGPHCPIPTSCISAESLLPVRFFLPWQRQELPGAVSPPSPHSGAQFPFDLNAKS